jgi:glycosyltransferase involved in cell wall biosynthesis
VNKALPLNMQKAAKSDFGTVAIGRNEGDRLKACLASLSDASTVVYVDSGSSDDSVQIAQDRGAVVVELDLTIPFTAARARNAGFARLRDIAPSLSYVQFVDGDCEIIRGWTHEAVTFLESRPDIAAVFGRLRERHPEQSVYNWLCDKEWNGPVGEVRSCAGNVMIRACALEAVGGYREDVIAAEEDELCVRLRAANWRIWRLESEMGLHDAAIMHFAQWWKRSSRTGYAFAQGAFLHGATPERHFIWQLSRTLLWGILLPFVCLVTGISLHPWGWTSWLVYPLQLMQRFSRQTGSFSDRFSLSFFELIGRFPESWGVIKFVSDRALDRRARIIEYK